MNYTLISLVKTFAEEQQEMFARRRRTGLVRGWEGGEMSSAALEAGEEIRKQTQTNILFQRKQHAHTTSTLVCAYTNVYASVKGWCILSQG